MSKSDEVKKDEKSVREQQIEARKAATRKRNPTVGSVRVLPANDDMRRLLKHPRGIAFPSGGGSVEWPNDNFTRRRIAEGAVTIEERAKPEKPNTEHEQRGGQGHQRRATPAADQSTG